ncbi:MAG: undecaprenyl-diphosphate phosphatase [Bacteroidetes bacterium]|nr:undecaprenyl-diphosphate phosphatase [Bacteroidota bacterium]
MTISQSIILSIIEGITEFLPVSSTGHMILASSVMGIEKEDFTKLFEVAIQLGAIVSVVVLYYKKFFDFKKWQFYIKLIVAVIPALILGFLFADQIDLLLGSPTIVALSLILGGIFLLFIDKIFFYPLKKDHVGEVSYKNALIIGIFQCLAMIPGVSRSAASIIGGMQQKLTRKLAAEFSFFLAVPTMAAATGYKLLKTFTDQPQILQDKNNITMLILGNIIAFIVAMLAIKFFITFIQKYGLKYFGWYRIFIGLVFLMLIKMNQIR